MISEFTDVAFLLLGAALLFASVAAVVVAPSPPFYCARRRCGRVVPWECGYASGDEYED